jgi:hypothetical protein
MCRPVASRGGQRSLPLAGHVGGRDGESREQNGGKCEHQLSGFQVPVDPASGMRASDDGGGRKVPDDVSAPSP